MNSVAITEDPVQSYEPEMPLRDINELLGKLEQDSFYGSLEVKFEAGKVVLLRKTETIKPTGTCQRNNRGQRWTKPNSQSNP